jgi:hypothetical protein
MKHKLSLLVCTLFTLTLSAQNILSTAGADSETVAWTVGEVVTETIIASDAIITQGFNQPSAIASTAISHPGYDDQAFRLWPNPVKDHLQFFSKNGNTCRWRLFNPLGKETASGIVSGQTGSIDLSSLPSGVYFLKMTAADAQQTVVILKN